VLNGIGGSTIEEAKRMMSYAEFQTWAKYKQMRGSINLGNRLESGFALMAWMFQKVHGGTAEQADFMPHLDRQPADIKAVMQMLSPKGPR
jgi:hypothetical protein